MLNFKSLAFKNAIVYLALFLAGLGLTGFLLLQNSSREIITSTEKNLVHSGELIRIKFSTYLTDLKNDLTHISKSPYLHAFLDNPNEENKALINGEYQSLLASKTDYAQIRFIGIEGNGREIIRVQRNGDSIQIVRETALQSKGGRDYFLETVEMEEDSMYISPINLNREYNTLSLPYMPTLRVAYPVYHHGDLKGILVINADLRVLFASLRQILDDKTKLFMLNQEGYYLMHEDSTQQFGFEFNKSSTFSQEFGGTIEEIERNNNQVFLREGLLNFIDQLSFPKKDYKIYIIVSADKQDLLGSYYIWRRNSFIIIAGLALTFMLLAFVYMNRQSLELREITNKLQAFPQKLEVGDLPVHRKDEIGDLATSFQEMSEVISGNIHSLNLAKSEAEAAVQEKIEFMENMSHEIRNPLQSIAGLSELLEKNAPAVHQQKIIKSLRFNTANLQNLVNDILDYKRLIRGDFKLTEEWVSLDELMQEIHGSHNYLAVTKKIQLQLEIDKNLTNREIFIDKTRINQILHNLITNAIKFTNEGGNVIIKVLFKKEKAKNSCLEFSVQDTGVGMDKETLALVKQRYFTRSNQEGGIEGFGLGLNIVVQILNYLQSELIIHSESGKGSAFMFELWLKSRSYKENKTENQMDFTTEVLNHLSIAVIDDDEQIIELYRHLFDGKTRNFFTAESPLALANQDLPPLDIILTDYQFKGKLLPEFDHALQAFSSPGTLFYIVTARHDVPLQESDIPQYILVQKPFNGDQLLLQIATDHLSFKYGNPDFSSIQKDYDFDEKKIKHAILLLEQEWENLQTKISHTLHAGDREGFRQFVHKMITSVRRLDLEKFEVFLQCIDDEFEHGPVQKLIPGFQEAMQYFLFRIRAFQEGN